MRPRRARDAHEARLEALREEARSGLASTEVRRTLIREQLRPPPRPIPTPPAQTSLATTRMGAASSAPHTSSPAEAVGCEEDDLPAAWLQGGFSLDDAPTASTISSSARNQHAALRAYESLCAVADSVVYDVHYEEALRCVEARDSDTGLATSWITRRAAPPPLGDSAAPLPRRRVASATTTAAAAAAASTSAPAHALRDTVQSLYTPPPSAHGSVSASVPPSRASLFSASSVALSRALSRRTSRGTVSTSRPSPPAAASAVGTAVLRSSAADFATALRRRVQAQRAESGVGGGRLGGLVRASSTCAGTPGADVRTRGEDDDGDGSSTWRTSVTAAVALAACPACGALFPYAMGTDAVCERCGQLVPTGKTAVGAEAAPQRWLLPPPLAPEPSATAPSPVAPPSPPPPPAPATSAVESCGTDSVGFTSDDGEESFAALIARIRAAKRVEVAGTNATPTTAAAAPVRVRQDAAAGEASTGMAATAAAASLLPQSAPAVVADPMVGRLRSALSRPYYLELARAARRPSPAPC